MYKQLKQLNAKAKGNGLTVEKVSQLKVLVEIVKLMDKLLKQFK